MIRLCQATKVFKTKHVETTALNKIDVSIDEAEFVAIMGPSGCGKSTLLSVIGLLDILSSGEYEFLGLRATDAPESVMAKWRRDNIGYVFQNFNLINSLSLIDNLLIPLKFVRLSKAEKRERALQALEVVGLGHRARHDPPALSGGQQQRAAIARAIVADPKLVIADEPTGNLDTENGAQILELLKHINELGKTVIMVTHDQRDAAYASRILRMRDGHLVTG